MSEELFQKGDFVKIIKPISSFENKILADRKLQVARVGRPFWDHSGLLVYLKLGSNQNLYSVEPQRLIKVKEESK